MVTPDVYYHRLTQFGTKYGSHYGKTLKSGGPLHGTKPCAFISFSADEKLFNVGMEVNVCLKHCLAKKYVFLLFQ